MKIIRVFPRKTSMSPEGDLVFFEEPGMFRPEADEVHVSVVFTWDIERGKWLADSWGRYYPVVKIGGPALGDCGEHIPGRYIREGVTFTTRGCNNNCPWCLVPSREGRLKELENYAQGHIIQDNNLLQTSREHQLKVYAMLKNQPKAAVFSGGIDARLVDDWFAKQMQSLRIKQLFLAADTWVALSPLKDALQRLSFLGRNKLRVFTLIAYNGESISEADTRLRRVWELGGMPFAQLYQPADHYINYSREWKSFARKWSRPAIMKAMMSTSGTTWRQEESAGASQANLFDKGSLV